MKLKHPESKQTIEVDDDRSAPYVDQGWVEPDDKKANEK